MAYFRKRGSGWSFSVEIGLHVNGKRKQQTVSGFKTKKEAQLAAAEIEQAVANETFVKESDIYFKDFADEWMSLYSQNVKPSTARIRQHEIDLLLYYFKTQKLKDITKKAYQLALVDLKKRNYADNTISGTHGTGKMIFKKALEFDLLKNDPTQFAKPPRRQVTLEETESEESTAKYLEKEQLALFLKATKDHGLDQDYPIFFTLAYSGIRAGELCSLKWSDIDFGANTISINRTYYNPKNIIMDYRLLPPKTKTSKRTIEIDPSVMKELEKHQAKQKVYKMQYRKEWHDKDFIFAKTEKNYGYPHYIKFIETRMARLLKLADLPSTLTPHSLRHTHTSLLAEAGVGLEEIMERLGHSDDETTRTIYLHVTKTMKKEASQKFSELMKSL